jgi:Rha family phage regulatory protein
MRKLSTTNQLELPSVDCDKGRIVTSSINVAETFGKRHADVIRNIQNLECSKEFTQRNFAFSEYKDSTGRKLPEYLITKDGFAMLAFGFTGKEAFKFKEAYINKFNRMEQILQEKKTQKWQEARQLGKAHNTEMMDTVKAFCEYAISQGSTNYKNYYTSFSKMANSSVDIGTGQRYMSDAKTLQTQTYVMELIKRTIEEEMAKGTHYKEIYQISKKNVKGLMGYLSIKK